MIKITSCEICGKETELVRAVIEDSEMSVCHNCSSLGRRLAPVRPSIKIRTPQKYQKVEKPLEIVKKNYAQLIRQSREKLNLKQKDLAKKLNEKESIIHKLETAQFTPSIELATKLEKFLNIQLIEKIHLEKEAQSQKITSGPMTIGDLIKGL